MLPSSPPIDPLAVALSVVGLLFSIPVLTLVVKGIFFIAKATSKLDLVDEIREDVRQIRHDRRNDQQETSLSLTIIEGDINDLQRHNDLPVRPYPDRRVGPADRRAS